MTRPIPTRFSDEELLAIDELIEAGVAASRSAVIRMAVDRLVDADRRARVGQAIVDAYIAVPQTAEENELARSQALALLADPAW